MSLLKLSFIMIIGEIFPILSQAMRYSLTVGHALVGRLHLRQHRLQVFLCIMQKCAHYYPAFLGRGNRRNTSGGSLKYSFLKLSAISPNDCNVYSLLACSKPKASCGFLHSQRQERFNKITSNNQIVVKKYIYSENYSVSQAGQSRCQPRQQPASHINEPLSQSVCQ